MSRVCYGIVQYLRARTYPDERFNDDDAFSIVSCYFNTIKQSTIFIENISMF